MDRGSRKRGDAAARQISRALIERGFTVHRYDAISTSSIYLKVDWGAGLSIRIADHDGYRHLNYRYNVDTSRKSGVRRAKVERNGRSFTRTTYGLGSVGQLVGDVARRRDAIIRSEGEAAYRERMEDMRAEARAATKGFYAHPETYEVRLEADND